MRTRQLFDSVVAAAIAEERRNATPVYTFALYHDHESRAVSACIDTLENSVRLVRSINSYNAKHFCRALKNGDLSEAALWTGNIGRSLSLGDFVLKNIGRTKSAKFESDPDFYVEMARSIAAAEADILACSTMPADVIFACSTAKDEVGLWWGPTSGACAKQSVGADRDG